MPFDVQHCLSDLPHKPGVYQMFDAKGAVLYIGKAKDVKKRVSSYFSAVPHSRKIGHLVQKIADITIVVTRNEYEALLLESQLIKTRKPRYNVLLRDDKSYPYLHLSTEHTFPRLTQHRGARSAEGAYFGPYPDQASVRHTLGLLQKTFLLRSCNDTFFKHRSRPCLQYQIKRCSAPCVGYIDPERYRQQVRYAALFLAGKNDALIQQLMEKMETSAELKQYGAAAQYRDQISLLRAVQQQQCIVQGKQHNVDVVAFSQAQGKTSIAGLFIRSGQVMGCESHRFSPLDDKDFDTILSDFLLQYYLAAARRRVVPQSIVLSHRINDRRLIERALREGLEQPITIIDVLRGEKRRWVEMAWENARHTPSHQQDRDFYRPHFQCLQNILPGKPHIQHMECFDVSHTQGEATVASCVVFDQTGPLKKQYRRFSIKNSKKGDDYAAMKEALMRHYRSLKKADAGYPDLLIVDGGKGQLTQAVSVFETLQIEGVVLLGIAKSPDRKAGAETLYLARNGSSIPLESDPSAHLLIQAIRDEAHRFALSGHRKQRHQHRLTSSLENIPGIGAHRRRLLLTHFGGMQGLQRAGLNELKAVPSMGARLAERLYHSLH